MSAHQKENSFVKKSQIFAKRYCSTAVLKRNEIIESCKHFQRAQNYHFAKRKFWIGFFLLLKINCQVFTEASKELVQNRRDFFKNILPVTAVLPILIFRREKIISQFCRPVVQNDEHFRCNLASLRGLQTWGKKRERAVIARVKQSQNQSVTNIRILDE